jgi:hypothetical protein
MTHYNTCRPAKMKGLKAVALLLVAALALVQAKPTSTFT